MDEGSDGVADSSLLPDQHGHPTWRIENRNETQSENHYDSIGIGYTHVHVCDIHVRNPVSTPQILANTVYHRSGNFC